MTDTRLGAFIRSRREARDLTQQQLAEATNTNRSNIEAIENGRVKQPSVPLLNAIARALRVSVREMVQAMGFAIEDDATALSSAEDRLLDDVESYLERLRNDRRRPRENGESGA